MSWPPTPAFCTGFCLTAVEKNLELGSRLLNLVSFTGYLAPEQDYPKPNPVQITLSIGSEMCAGWGLGMRPVSGKGLDEVWE